MRLQAQGLESATHCETGRQVTMQTDSRRKVAPGLLSLFRKDRVKLGQRL
jgi:hypothetical protein